MGLNTGYFRFYENAPKERVLTGNLLTDDIKIILCTSSYVPDLANDLYYDGDITGELPTNYGYTSGGISLATKALSVTGNPGEYQFTSDPVVWSVTSSSLTMRLFVLYNNTPVSSKPLIGYAYLNYNGGTPLDITQPPGYDFTIYNPQGWFYVKKQDAI